MVRALLIEFPDDPGAWNVEDEYMFGSQMLVAPLLESGDERTCYLPQGKWIDYQTGKVYDGGYRTIKAGEIPCIILIRDGSIIPQVPVAQSTAEIKWDKMELKTYKVSAKKCTGLVFKPGDKDVRTVTK